jgi:hypothetical protein
MCPRSGALPSQLRPCCARSAASPTYPSTREASRSLRTSQPLSASYESWRLMKGRQGLPLAPQALTLSTTVDLVPLTRVEVLVPAVAVQAVDLLAGEVAEGVGEEVLLAVHLE